MQKDTAQKIIEVNRQFYQNFGAEFSATRGRIQFGVRKILKRIGRNQSLLDLGCGNGEFSRQLAKAGHAAPYLGVDFSLPLLKDAQSPPKHPCAKFYAFDLSADDWSLLPKDNDLITAFALLHHIPGEEMRLRIFENIRKHLAPRGEFIFSTWQFLNAERLRKRIQAWDKVGIRETDVDAGDYLLDWRRGGYGFRYAHQYSEAELRSLAQKSGFRVLESFYSDGATKNLGLYQIWAKSA